MRAIVGFVVLWLMGSMTEAKAQQITKDSLQKHFLQVAKDSIRKDSLRSVLPLKDSLTKAIIKPAAVKHSPKKAAYYSLMLPGLGQAYNKQYWKMPFVYAGCGTVAYFIWHFNIRYKDFLAPYIASYNPDTGKQLRTEAEVFVRNQSQTRTLTIDQITKGKDLYRRYRDLNIVLLAGAWALAAVEANVAAHLKTFDMSDDISLRFRPDASFSPFTGTTFGVKIVMQVK